AITAAREFRFDSPRARYLCRDVDPVTFEPPAGGSQQWTHYAGVTPFLDSEVATDTGVETDTLAYAAGLGLGGQQTISTGETEHFHADLLGSTVLTTNSAGLLEHSFAYSAFGEAVTYDTQAGWQVGFPPADSPTRYQYAGGWGYESGAGDEPGLLWLQGADASLPPITLQHVGARWYEPAIGRFVQRDPIGIRGGLNVYLYCNCSPLIAVDPSGLDELGPIPRKTQEILRKLGTAAELERLARKHGWRRVFRKLAQILGKQAGKGAPVIGALLCVSDAVAAGTWVNENVVIPGVKKIMEPVNDWHDDIVEGVRHRRGHGLSPQETDELFGLGKDR
ncbi:MAG: RHS repeat-associated core domain-containing protein, partial [Planctomycetes bacterium]|nr:RHS repeat-associated core domain-containing protein [Planctomycetota bacterium]